MRGLKKAAALLGSLLMVGEPEPTRAQEPAAVVPAAVRVQREAYLMGTRLRVEVVAPTRAEGIEATEEVFRIVEEVEETLSDFRPEAELSRVNAASERTHVPLSDALTRMLCEAFAWSDRTGGAFDPVVGSLVEVWDLRGTGRVPTAAELARAREAAGTGAVIFDPAARTLARRSPDVALDPGGFGKGEALRAAGERLRELNVESAWMDFGGQVQALGGSAGGRESPWLTGIAHPFARSVAVGAIALMDVSASTSGPSERGVLLDGRPVSHHVDPRTGHPVEAWGSVTVVAEDAFAADVLSTALYVMGPEAGIVWAEELEDVGVLFLTQDGEGAVRARMNTEMERWWVKGSFVGVLDEQ
jgi:thiamine biosynthesis lipoprotein